MVKTLCSLLLIVVFLAQQAHASPAKSDDAASLALPNWLQDLRDAIQRMLGIEPGKSIKFHNHFFAYGNLINNEFTESQQCNCDSTEFCENRHSTHCPEGEVFINQGSTCDITCAYYRKQCIVETLVPAKGCYCRPGFARLNNGTCSPRNLRECRTEYLADEQYNSVAYVGVNCSASPDG